MPGDEHVGMAGKRLGFTKDNPPVFALPIPVHTPSVAFMWMAPQSPPAQLVMDAMVHLAKDGLRHDMSVVPRPAGNDGSQSLGQGLLARAAMPSDQGARAPQVTLLGLPTRFDQRLETQGLTRSVLSASMAANVILADVEAEKVAPRLPLVGMQGVGDAAFARFEPQTDVLQPPFRLIAQRVERLQVTMENEGVVSVSHDRRLPVMAVLPARDAVTICRKFSFAPNLGYALPL